MLETQGVMQCTPTKQRRQGTQQSRRASILFHVIVQIDCQSILSKNVFLTYGLVGTENVNRLTKSVKLGRNMLSTMFPALKRDPGFFITAECY